MELNGKLPEKVAIKGLQLVKLQARRQDMVGDVAMRTLRIFNGSFKTIARTAGRFEQATELAPRRRGQEACGQHAPSYPPPRRPPPRRLAKTPSPPRGEGQGEGLKQAITIKGAQPLGALFL